MGQNTELNINVNNLNWKAFFGRQLLQIKLCLFSNWQLFLVCCRNVQM